MRIGIDARPFKYREYKGIANTTFSIIREWQRIYPENEYFLISNSEINLKESLPSNWKKIVKGKIRNGVAWTVLELPSIIRQLELDAFWGTNFILPKRIKGCRYVVTVHDLALFRYRKTASAGTYLTLRLLGKKSCENADKVLAVSETTARDVEDIFGITKEKITVCYNGMDSAGEIQSHPESVPKEMLDKTDSEFFLFLSTIEPRKNPETVLHAFEKLCEKEGMEKRYLVYAGANGWRNRHFYELVNRSQCRDHVIFTGYITEEEKQWLLRHATCFVYPSLYEGFGLPILEAMANKTLVVTANVSAMPEVAGKAALYIDDPLNVEELSERMSECLQMPMERKRELIEKMMIQVRKYTWEKSAESVMKQIVVG